MRPTTILMNEHRVIEQVLSCVERIASDCEARGRLDVDSARAAIEFLRNFADRCHHGKEEDELFPLMEQRGFSPDQGPTAVMRDEHVQGRAHIAAMDHSAESAGQGEPEGCATFVRHARRYVLLLREHIQKEDHCLFPMADDVLGPDDQTELARRFERVERHDIGDGVHDRYARLADELADRWQVAKVGVEAHTGCGCTAETHG